MMGLQIWNRLMLPGCVHHFQPASRNDPALRNRYFSNKYWREVRRLESEGVKFP